MTDAERKPPADATSVYYLGQSLVSMAVCAPAGMDAAAVAADANRANPTGITGGWAYDEAEQPADGPNPRPCPDDPQGRRHWLLIC